jgi:hypothetical protein
VTPSDPNAQQPFTAFPPTPPAQPGRASASPPKAAPPSPRRKRGPGIVVIGGVAVLALILSAFAALNSWRTTSSVDDLQRSVDNLARGPQPAAPSAAEIPATDAPTETTDPPETTPTGSVPSLNAQTQFTVNYTGKRMRIPATCGEYVYIDLDEPRIQTANGVAELTYHNNCNTETPDLTISNDGVEGSEVQSEKVTPAECTSAIQLSPLPRTKLPIRQGQVYCIKTSLGQARESAQTWKMVILSVTSVGQDDTIGLEASAWDIPS